MHVHNRQQPQILYTDCVGIILYKNRYSRRFSEQQRIAISNWALQDMYEKECNRAYHIITVCPSYKHIGFRVFKVSRVLLKRSGKRITLNLKAQFFYLHITVTKSYFGITRLESRRLWVQSCFSHETSWVNLSHSHFLSPEKKAGQATSAHVAKKTAGTSPDN